MKKSLSGDKTSFKNPLEMALSADFEAQPRGPNGGGAFENAADDASTRTRQRGWNSGGSPEQADQSIDWAALGEGEEEDDDDPLQLAKMGLKAGLGLGRGTGTAAVGILSGVVAVGTLGQKGTLQMPSHGSSPRVLTDQLRSLFDEIDVDGGGTIDHVELRQLIQGLGVQLTDAELATSMVEIAGAGRDADTFSEADAHELEVSFEQFHIWWVQQMEGKGSGISRLAQILRGGEQNDEVKLQQLHERVTWVDPNKPFKRTWDSFIIIVLLVSTTPAPTSCLVHRTSF